MKTPLRILAADTVERLRSLVKNDETLESYRVFGRTFSFSEAETLPSIIEVEAVPPDLDPDRNRKTLGGAEFENARAIYEYLGPMEEAAARDTRLWVHLTHTSFHSYCQRRWGPKGNTADDWRGPVADHWFVKGGGLGALRRNAIARLWWAAHLTCEAWTRDPRLEPLKNDDRWYYTRVLLANQDVYQGLVERSFGSDRVILLAALAIVGTNVERRATTSFANALTKEINLISSYGELGAMPVAELVDVLERAGKRIESR